MTSIVMVLLFIFTSYSQTNMKEICQIRYKGDLKNLNGKEIIINEKVVALLEKVTVEPLGLVNHVQKEPLSLFFIIDNSNSMSFLGEMNDVDGLRYSFTRELIDTINQIFDSSSSEIGFAVYSQQLFFLPDADSRLKTLPAPYGSGSYFPMLNLNASFAPDGLNGFEILQKWLKTKEYTKEDVTYIDLEYQPDSLWLGNSHINIGFEAARTALSDTKMK